MPFIKPCTACMQGLWGPGSAFADFQAFLDSMKRRGVSFLEMLAMEMKSEGYYVARGLSFQCALPCSRDTCWPLNFRMSTHSGAFNGGHSICRFKACVVLGVWHNLFWDSCAGMQSFQSCSASCRLSKCSCTMQPCSCGR